MEHEGTSTALPLAQEYIERLWNAPDLTPEAVHAAPSAEYRRVSDTVIISRGESPAGPIWNGARYCCAEAAAHDWNHAVGLIELDMSPYTEVHVEDAQIARLQVGRSQFRPGEATSQTPGQVEQMILNAGRVDKPGEPAQITVRHFDSHVSASSDSYLLLAYPGGRVILRHGAGPAGRTVYDNHAGETGN